MPQHHGPLGPDRVISIDHELKSELDKVIKDNKIDLDNKHIYLLSIALALKYHLQLKPSKRKEGITRTSYLAEEASMLCAFVYQYSEDISILYPENRDKFFEIAEKLANAGIKETIKLISSPGEMENAVLILANEMSSSD